MSELGEAWVRIRPNVAGFAAEVEGATKAATATAERSGKVKVSPDTTKFGAELEREVGPQLRDAHSRFTKLPVEPDTRQFGPKLHQGISGPLKSAAAAIGGLFIIQKGFQFGKGAIEDAASMEKVVGRVKTVFQGSAAAVLAFGEQTSKSMGLSAQQADAATARFGNLFLNLGVTRPAALQMSEAMVKLSADMASFANVSPEQAMMALQRGLAGQTRGLKSYGIVIDQSAIKVEALRLGLVKVTHDTPALEAAQVKAAQAQIAYTKAVADHGAKSLQARAAEAALGLANEAVAKAMQGTTGALTPAAKAQAAYSLIVKNSSRIQGDFAKNSGGLANQQKILGAQIADLKDKIGALLLPVLTSVARTITGSVLPAVASLFNFLRENSWVAKLAGGLTAVALALLTISKAAAIGKDVMTGFQVAVKLFTAEGIIAQAVMKVWAAMQWLLNAAMDANPIGIVIVAVAALVAGFIIAYKHSATFRAIVQAALKAVGEAGKWLVATFKKVWGDFLTDIRNWSANVTVFLKGAWAGITAVFKAGVAAVLWVVRTYLGLIKWEWDTAWHALSTVVSTVAGLVKGGVGLMFSALRTVFRTEVAGLGAVWNGLKALMGAPINFIIGTVLDNGLIRAINDVAGVIPGVPKIPSIPLIKYARGGAVPGVGEGDTVPALLTPGEFVLTKAAVRALGVLTLEQLNAQHFVGGGVVQPAGGTKTGPIIGGDPGRTIVGGVEKAVGAATNLLRGGIADIAGAIIMPVEKKVEGFMSHFGRFGQILGAVSHRMLEAALTMIRGKQDAMSAGGGGTFSGGGSFTGTMAALFNYAKQFLGLPYIWGGTGPAGYDCSGLMQHVFAHFGLGLPRLSQDQARMGVEDPGGRPGDLVYYGNPAHHIGLYLGGGSMLEAPHTGDVIKIAGIGTATGFRRLPGFDNAAPSAKKAQGFAAGGLLPPGVIQGWQPSTGRTFTFNEQGQERVIPAGASGESRHVTYAITVNNYERPLTGHDLLPALKQLELRHA